MTGVALAALAVVQTEAAEKAKPDPRSGATAPATGPRDSKGGVPAKDQVPFDAVAQEVIELLIKRGAITREDADALVARVREKVQGSAEATAGTVRIVYLTQIEQEQIRNQIREEVLAKARREGWAQPDIVPEWVKHIDLAGDVRTRYEWDAFDRRNITAINFQAINSGPPLDTNFIQNDQPPWLNTTQDRRPVRLRARVGVAVEVTSSVHAGIRFATANPGNPVSEDETVSTDEGDLHVGIDQAFIRYAPADYALFNIGRFTSPFMSTELIWDPDLSLDGLATKISYQDTYLTLGGFMIGATPFNYQNQFGEQIGSRDKWLYAAQLGSSIGSPSKGTLTLAASYYYYHNIEGELSSFCAAYNASTHCDTDATRPGFLQKGNTLFPIRVTPGTTDSTQPNFQYFGLASPFHELSLTMRIDVALGAKTHMIVDGEGVKNLAFDKASAQAKGPVNNLGQQQCDATGCRPPVAPYEGGSVGYLFSVAFGQADPSQKGAWNASVGYRRLESDAVVDAFTDSEFHLGGTNAQGFMVGGSYAFTKGLWASLRWLSATEVSAAPLASDVYQLDLSTRF
jgi:hypothetical protein